VQNMCTQTTCRTRNQAAVQNMKPSDTQDKISFLRNLKCYYVMGTSVHV
jgi:hypothetical protein